MLTSSSTARPTPPSSDGPKDTFAVTVEFEVSTPLVLARFSSAPWKQAAYPAANSVSGLTAGSGRGARLRQVEVDQAVGAA